MSPTLEGGEMTHYIMTHFIGHLTGPEDLPICGLDDLHQENSKVP